MKYLFKSLGFCSKVHCKKSCNISVNSYVETGRRTFLSDFSNLRLTDCTGYHRVEFYLCQCPAWYHWGGGVYDAAAHYQGTMRICCFHLWGALMLFMLIHSQQNRALLCPSPPVSASCLIILLHLRAAHTSTLTPLPPSVSSSIPFKSYNKPLNLPSVPVSTLIHSHKYFVEP